MRRALSAVVVVALASLAVGSATAMAATEFGSSCTANRAEEGKSFAVIQLSQNGVQTVAPASGVITNWRIRLVPAPISVPQQLKVFRATGNPSQFQEVGESATSSVVSGENTFATRIPIQAGDRIGLFGNGAIGTLFCAENPETESPANSIGMFPGTPTPGSTVTVAESRSEVLVPAVAVIEPDADNDGYGDETQDKGPQNAAVQAPCPVIPPVTLSASSVAKKGLVTVLITSNAQAPVTVAGTVKLGNGKPAKLNGGTQIVAPGAIAKFTLLFPQALKAKLKLLSPKQSLSLAVTATATNSAGVPNAKNLKVKLKGQAKPKPKLKAKPKTKAKG